MAGDLINLNRARKAKAKSAEQAQAAQNRARFGQSKAQKTTAKAEAAKLARTVEDARRDR